VLVVVVLGAGMAVGAGDGTADPAAGARSGAASVDVVAEDRAIALLDLYRREAEAAALLRAHRDVFTEPRSPSTAAVETVDRLAQARREVEAALDQVHLLVDPGAPARAYIHDGGHRGLLLTLEEAGSRAQAVGLLAGTHDALAAGTVASPTDDLREALVRGFGPDSKPELRRWAGGLLAALGPADPDADPGADSHSHPGAELAAMAAASAARAESLAAWSMFVSAAAPPATQQLQDFLGTMSPDTLAALAGHPVAGPALARLGANG